MQSEEEGNLPNRPADRAGARPILSRDELGKREFEQLHAYLRYESHVVQELELVDAQQTRAQPYLGVYAKQDRLLHILEVLHWNHKREEDVDSDPKSQFFSSHADEIHQLLQEANESVSILVKKKSQSHAGLFFRQLNSELPFMCPLQIEGTGFISIAYQVDGKVGIALSRLPVTTAMLALMLGLEAAMFSETTNSSGGGVECFLTVEQNSFELYVLPIARIQEDIKLYSHQLGGIVSLYPIFATKTKRVGILRKVLHANVDRLYTIPECSGAELDLTTGNVNVLFDSLHYLSVPKFILALVESQLYCVKTSVVFGVGSVSFERSADVQQNILGHRRSNSTPIKAHQYGSETF